MTDVMLGLGLFGSELLTMLLAKRN